MKMRPVGVIVIMATTLLVVTAQAQNNSWATSVSGRWDGGGNWSLGVAPTNTQSTVAITNATTKTIQIDSLTASFPDMTISNLVLSGPVGTTNTLSMSNAGLATPLRIFSHLALSSGGALQITNSSLRVDGLPGGEVDDDGVISLISGSIITTNVPLVVGGVVSGAFTNAGGTMLAGEVFVGSMPGASGSAVFKAGTNILSSFLDLGNYEASTASVVVAGGLLVVTNSNIHLADGGVAQMTVSNGTVVTSGMYVGNFLGSVGTLTMAGGTNIFSSFLEVGDMAGATGNVWISGGELFTATGTVTIANNGVGRMTISNGTVSTSGMYVGNLTGSQGTLTMAGGTNIISSFLDVGELAAASGTVWMTAGQLAMTNSGVTIGDYGVGRMTVSNGTLQLLDMLVGGHGGSSGTLTVAGGTTSVADAFDVGTVASATGAVWVTGGQLLLTNVATNIGFQGVGQMTVSNGIVMAYVGSVGSAAGSSGALTIAGGTTTFDPILSIGSASTVLVTGGTLSVTNEFGNAEIVLGTGSFTQNGGTVTIDRLVATSLGSVFQFNGGVLTTKGMIISNGASTFVGSGPTPATLNILGGNNFINESLFLANTADSTATVWVSGANLTVTGDAGSSVFIGYTGIGQMTMSNTTLLAQQGFVGTEPGSSGTLTIAGGNETFTTMDVGYALGAAGSLWMKGGILTMVDFWRVGESGSGQMTVSNGLVLAGDGYVGFESGSLGTLTVAGGTNQFLTLTVGGYEGGTGTLWVTGGQLIVTNSNFPELDVGDGGIGQMTVSNGSLLVYDAVIGEESGSGTLTVVGGKTQITSSLSLGGTAGGTGTVWMSGGMLIVTNGSSDLGDEGVGRMTMSNGTFLAKNVNIGNVSTGALTVAGGTLLANNVSLGSYLNTIGTLTAAGGELTASSVVVGDCAADAEGDVFVRGGSLHVTNATHTAVMDVRNGFVLLTAGRLVVDKLVMTNACSFFIQGGGTLLYNELVLDPDLSAVGDGIPNGWKLQHGLNPFDPSVASADPDGDGVNNLYEYQLGTDPMDAQDPWRITAIARKTNDILITWQYVPRPYSAFSNCIVETSATLPGTWRTLSGTITLPSGPLAIQSTNYLDVGGATNTPSRYYRVRLVP